MPSAVSCHFYSSQGLVVPLVSPHWDLFIPLGEPYTNSFLHVAHIQSMGNTYASFASTHSGGQEPHSESISRVSVHSIPHCFLNIRFLRWESDFSLWCLPLPCSLSPSPLYEEGLGMPITISKEIIHQYLLDVNEGFKNHLTCSSPLPLKFLHGSQPHSLF